MNSLKFCSANEHHVRSPTRKSEGRKITELCTFLTSAAMASVAQLIYVEPELPLMMTCSFSCSCVKWQGLCSYQCCCCCCCCDKICFISSFWSGFIWKIHKRNLSHFIRLESRSTELSGKYKHLTLPSAAIINIVFQKGQSLSWAGVGHVSLWFAGDKYKYVCLWLFN